MSAHIAMSAHAFTPTDRAQGPSAMRALAAHGARRHVDQHRARRADRVTHVFGNLWWGREEKKKRKFENGVQREIRIGADEKCKLVERKQERQINGEKTSEKERARQIK